MNSNKRTKIVRFFIYLDGVYMLRKKIIRKICYTTLIFFILLIITTFYNQDIIMETKKEYKNDLLNIYLLNDSNYLTEVTILVSDKNDYKTVFEIVEGLKNNNQYYNSLRGIIPNNTIINKLEFEKQILYIDFNEELLNVKKDLEEKVIEALVFSIMNIKDIKGIKISINGNNLDILPKTNIILSNILTKDFGINKEYNLTRTSDILKVVLYYYQEIDDNEYFVPVTKYINQKEDKIKVIIDNLKNSYLYQTNLMSYLNDRIDLLNYEENNNIVSLSFHNLITLDPQEAKEEVIYTIANSIFSSTNHEKIIFMEDDMIIKIMLRE